jgi:Ca2+-binding EF-hand superfamily protein
MATNPPYDAQASTNYKEAFALFDKRGTQRVQVDSLGDLLRACGQNPTLAEIRDLEKGVGGECMFLSSAFHFLSIQQFCRTDQKKKIGGY